MRDKFNRGKIGRQFAVAAVGVAMGVGSAGVALAKDKAQSAPSVWNQETFTGDAGGARTALKEKNGIDISLIYVGEAFSVLSGGLNRKSSYEGRLEFSVDTDLQKLMGWTGATTHVTIFQIHNSGHNVAEYAGAIADPSNIDATPTTRLFTAWYEQNFNDRMSVRVGQLAADDEFLTSETAGGLLNGTFGWAGILAGNMTNGGPAYPLATPGLRVQVNATEQLSVRGAVFAGDPAGRNCTLDAQVCNDRGVTFSTSGGTLWMGEVQYAINQAKMAAGLPGVYKLGAWYATADFADQHFGVTAGGATVSLANPAAVGPLNHSGNWGLYGVADQMVWRGGESSLNLFLRGGFAPSDRNMISFYVDGGAGIKGPLPGRADDVLTFGVAYAKISGDAAALDQDAGDAVRDDELVFEVSYAAQIAPWWIIQPDLQYIVHPNGGQNPDTTTASLNHAFVAGVRSTIKF